MHKSQLRLIKKGKKDRPKTPKLTPAEEAEVARFKALTAKRAAHRATVHRLIARLQARDDTTDAA
jgi:hypothetical protein